MNYSFVVIYVQILLLTSNELMVIFLYFLCHLGLNQLLWYYADMEKQRCPNATTIIDHKNPSDPDACIVWRRFAK